MNTNGARMEIVIYRNPVRDFVDNHPVIFGLVVVLLVAALIWFFKRRRTN
jgi:LPXTG-motif cell wall-anchored protein